MNDINSFFIQKGKEENDIREFAEQNINNLPKIKAYKFIEYLFNNHWKGFSDDEFLVFLISRGHNFNLYQSNKYDTWRMLEAEIIKECELTDIQDVPDSQLPYFWNYKNCDEYTIDSTMIRVAEWCKLTGFDRYWNKLTFDMELTIDRLPHKKLHLIQFMYSICRSELAMEKMRNKLSKLCELISVPYIDENDFFWEDRSSYNSKKGTTNHPISHQD